MSDKVQVDKKYLKRLEQKAKVGWACFYNLENLNNQLHHEYMASIKELQEQVEKPEEINLNHIFNEMNELYDKLKKSVECPICLEDLTSKDIKYSSCGHRFCATCLSKIDKCAICKRKIYHKNIKE